MLTPFGRRLKQTNIFLIFLILLIGTAFLLYISMLEPKKIEIKPVEVERVEGKLKEEVWKPPFTYSLSAEIKNPNENFIAGDISYSFEIKDDKNDVISKKEGKTEIGKDQSKKIEEEVITQGQGKDFDFKISKDIEWEKVLNNSD